MGRHTRLILDSLVLGVVGALTGGLFMHLLHLAQGLFLGGIAVPAISGGGGGSSVSF